MTTEQPTAPNALDIALDALRLIAGNTCSRSTAGSGSCWRNYERGARYSADAWCDECIALDALRRIEAGGGEPPSPSWQQILTAERDEAIDRAERVVSVAQHMADAQQRLRVAAEAVLAVPEKTVDNVKELTRG